MLFLKLGGSGNNFRSGQKFPGKVAPAWICHPPKSVGGYVVFAITLGCFPFFMEQATCAIIFSLNPSGQVVPNHHL